MEGGPRRKQDGDCLVYLRTRAWSAKQSTSVKATMITARVLKACTPHSTLGYHAADRHSPRSVGQLRARETDAWQRLCGCAEGRHLVSPQPSSAGDDVAASTKAGSVQLKCFKSPKTPRACPEIPQTDCQRSTGSTHKNKRLHKASREMLRPS